MAGFLRFLAGLGGDVFRARRALICENALLRQQLIVAERRLSGHCFRWRPWERFAMALAASMAPACCGDARVLKVATQELGAVLVGRHVQHALLRRLGEEL